MNVYWRFEKYKLRSFIESLKVTSWEVLLNLTGFTRFYSDLAKRRKEGNLPTKKMKKQNLWFEEKKIEKRINLSVSRIWTSEFQKNCFSSKKKNFVSSYFAVQASQWDFLPSDSYTDTDTDTDSVLSKISKNNNRPTMKFCLACTITNQTAKTFNLYI
jgi:hypothetical protein